LRSSVCFSWFQPTARLASCFIQLGNGGVLQLVTCFLEIVARTTGSFKVDAGPLQLFLHYAGAPLRLKAFSAFQIFVRDRRYSLPSFCDIFLQLGEALFDWPRPLPFSGLRAPF
jgi:hypothetical protein